MKFKHITIKEVMVMCDFCNEKESFTPRRGETIKSLEPEVFKSGWSIVKGKTMCGDCYTK